MIKSDDEFGKQGESVVREGVVYVVGLRGRGSFAAQLGKSAEFVKKECEHVNCTSMSRNKEFPCEQLSPIILGPVECYDGLQSKTMENAWQYAKVYDKFIDAKAEPTTMYFAWRDEGFAATRGVRYPLGPFQIPLYTYWKIGGKAVKLDYIEARKRIYIPEYAKLVTKTPAFKKLQALKRSGKNIILSDFDGWNHLAYKKRREDCATATDEFATYQLSLGDVINFPYEKMGHAFVLAMLLEGLVKVDDKGNVTTDRGLFPPSEKVRRLTEEIRAKRQADEDEKRRQRELDEASRLRSEAKKPHHQKNENDDKTVNLKEETPKTDREFLRKVQKTVLVSLTEAADQLAVQSCELARECEQVKIEFDRIYRPFVYKVLVGEREKDGLAFKRRVVKLADGRPARIPFKGEVSGEDVYTNVWMLLFGGNRKPVLLNFDVTRDRVGRGAFRDYLRQVVHSVYYTMVRREMTTQKDVHGNVMYKQDRHGQYLLDAKGKRIPIRVPRLQTGLTDTELGLKLAAAEYAEKAQMKRLKSVFKRRINIKYMAYLLVRSKQPKNGWFYQAATDIYEKGMPKDAVMADCLKRGVIKSRNPFDKACSVFKKAVDEKSAELTSVISRGMSKEDLAEDDLIEREWDKMSVKFGKTMVDDIRYRVMKAMMDAFEDGNR